jgi:pimeloyl-ACP methyl ester carboxylesterase
VLESDRPAGVTLYLHEFSFGKWMWHFPDPRYDFVTNLAERGHVSVIVDRLGYDESPRPPGHQICLGGDADMAHQMVAQLRSGAYDLGGLAPRSFDRVVLAGHSGGAMVAQVAAYSFGGIDGLMNFAHVDQGFTPSGLAFGVTQGAICGLGGQPSDPGRASGYAYFAQTDAEWRYAFMHIAEPAIAAAATGMRNRDPCGDVFSFVPGHLVDHRRLREVTVPTLLLYPRDDTNYMQPWAGRQQRRLFTGASDVTLEFFSGAHAMPLQRSAPTLQASVSAWLEQRGFD